jgi:hypothetical protein
MWIDSKVLESLGVSSATIHRKTKSGAWQSREVRNGQRGRPRKEIRLMDLPQAIQLRWQQRASAAPESAAVETTDPVPPRDPLDRLGAALARFSPPNYTLEQRQAVERRCTELATLCDRAARLVVDLKRARGLTSAIDRSHPDARLAELAQSAASVDPIYIRMYPSRAAAPSLRTFMKWVSSYQSEGPASFIRDQQTLSPAIDSRFAEVPDAAIEWLRCNLKNYVRASVTTYGKRWLAWASANGIKLPFTDSRPGAASSCYTWLYRWRQKVPATTMTLVTKGERGLEAKYAYILRDYSELRPRLGYTMDWKQFDVACWRTAKKGAPPLLARLWLCPVFDLASRAVFGFNIADRPSARGITFAYLDAIGDSEWKSEPGLELLRGIQRSIDPSILPFLLWDNGKDFRAGSVEGRVVDLQAVGPFDLETGLTLALNTQNIQVKIGLAPDLNIQVRHAKPFNAKSKIIEGWFGYAVRHWEESIAGYCGGKPEKKPFYYPAALSLHKRFSQGRDPKPGDLEKLPPLWRETYEENKRKYGYGTPFLHEEVFRAQFAAWLVEYLRSPHGSLADDRGDMSPLQYLELNADTPHMLTELSMTSLMMESRPETVTNGEIKVAWGGHKFTYREVESDISDGRALYRLPSKAKVDFRFKADSIGRALVISGGGPLCWVQEPELLGWNASRADFDRANARKKAVRRTANEFFETQSRGADWHDEAAERHAEQSNVVELRAVSGGSPQFVSVPTETNSGSPLASGEAVGKGASAPLASGTRASITALTRFDRKSSRRSGISEAPISPSKITGQEEGFIPAPGLRALPSREDAGWAEDVPEISTQAPASDDDWIEPWE